MSIGWILLIIYLSGFPVTFFVTAIWARCFPCGNLAHDALGIKEKGFKKAKMDFPMAIMYMLWPFTILVLIAILFGSFAKKLLVVPERLWFLIAFGRQGKLKAGDHTKGVYR